MFIDPATLKAEIPQLVLRPGVTLAARVAETHGSRGLLMIANAALVAELPEGVKAGDTLRLRVQEASADRIVMRMESEAQQPPIVPIPLPEGQQAHVYVDEREGEGRRSEEQAAAAITYRSPALGAIHFRLGLAGGALTAQVRAKEGAPYELARTQAEELRDALHRASGKPVQLTVSPRHDPLDVYA